MPVLKKVVHFRVHIFTLGMFNLYSKGMAADSKNLSLS